jgi:hypothetical protein
VLSEAFVLRADGAKEPIPLPSRTSRVIVGTAAVGALLVVVALVAVIMSGWVQGLRPHME